MTNPPVEVRRIRSCIDPGQFDADLQTMQTLALESGSTDAAIIDVSRLVLSQDILAHVSDTGYPSRHWPVNYPNDSIEEAVRAYARGLFFRVCDGNDFPKHSGGPILEPLYRDVYLKVYEITSLIESTAFYMGYYLAMGFATGNCRSLFCHNERSCEAIVKGRACRHPYIARPSMEAVGMDARAMAHDLGWANVPPVNAGFPSGLVLIA